MILINSRQLRILKTISQVLIIHMGQFAFWDDLQFLKPQGHLSVSLLSFWESGKFR